MSSSASPNLTLDVVGAVATVRLRRPEARNALDPALMAALTEVARELRGRTDLRAIVLAGAPEFFSAGMDLKAVAPLLDPAGGATLLERRERLRAGPDLCAAWEAIETVTIAAVEGYCLGGAAALVLACDFRVVGAGATLRLPEVPLGMNMSWHSLPRLAALVGPARAKRIAMLGEDVDAPTMLAWGLADELAPSGGAETAARRWADAVAALPPLPVRMTKEAINAAVQSQHQALAWADRDQFLLTTHSADLREGLEAFFGKRPPRFTGD